MYKILQTIRKICGYSKHVEICHVKDICEFSIETLITEINSIKNLKALCPTHHWEFDHGYLELINDEFIEILNPVKKPKHKHPIKCCPYCQIKFEPKENRQIFCSVSCVTNSSRRSERPSVEQLQNEINTMTWVAIGKKYGVSDNAIKKWANNYGITKQK